MRERLYAHPVYIYRLNVAPDLRIQLSTRRDEQTTALLTPVAREVRRNIGWNSNRLLSSYFLH